VEDTDMTRTIHRLAAVAAAFALVAVALAAPAAAEGAGTVNVNTASVTELERLPGIGPSVAARIVEHREQNGAFKAAEDLMLVRGVGEKTFERIKPYVAVSGATTLKENVPSPRPARTGDAAKG
jgi:competence protein ComEA